MEVIFRNTAALSNNSILVDKSHVIHFTVNRDADFQLYALSLSAPYILKQAKIIKRTALILEIEVDDLLFHILQKSKISYISISHSFDSFNVATISGITPVHFSDFDKPH
ncbi:hypothetical protein [Bartonella alsatica]|nr:hypothetical protein [Bartonella alsatica]